MKVLIYIFPLLLILSFIPSVVSGTEPYTDEDLEKYKHQSYKKEKRNDYTGGMPQKMNELSTYQMSDEYYRDLIDKEIKKKMRKNIYEMNEKEKEQTKVWIKNKIHEINAALNLLVHTKGQEKDEKRILFLEKQIELMERFKKIWTEKL